VDSEPAVSALKIFSLVLAGLAVPVFAHPPSGQIGELPSQAKPVEDIVMPIPKEIFSSLDKFENINWRAVQRPEIVRWRSRGEPVQVAVLLGVTVAEGFIAVEAEDSAEVKSVGNRVLTLSRALGVRKIALRRSRSIMDLAEQNKWKQAREEWDGVLSDLETGMIALKSEQLSQLVSMSGWMRGTEALCALVLQGYSPERAQLIRQPVLLDRLAKQLREMSGQMRGHPAIVKMTDGIQRIRLLIENENGPPAEKTVKEIGAICEEVIHASAGRSR
jgi:hypothetical protein